MEDIFQEVNKAKKLLSTLSDANNREQNLLEQLKKQINCQLILNQVMKYTL